MVNVNSFWRYSFLTKSAKLKRGVVLFFPPIGYSFLTKSAKLKLSIWGIVTGMSYSFLTKSAKLKLSNTFE